MLVGDKVRIKDEYINSLGRKGEVMTVTQTYTLGGNLMCDVGNGIAYREDVLELVTEFEKAKAKHEELLAERDKAPKQMTYLESEFIKRGFNDNNVCELIPNFLCDIDGWNCKGCKFNHKTAKEVIEMLFKPVEEPNIELNSMEYYLICEESHLPVDNQLKFEDNCILNGFKNKGYFKGITDTSLKPNEILKRAVIVDE